MSERSENTFDPRVYIFLVIAGAIAGLIVHREGSLLAVFIIALAWQLIAGRFGDALGYVFIYFFLWAITRLGIVWLASSPGTSFAISLTNAGIAGRRALPPLLFAFILAAQPTGSLLAALYAMRLPKPFGIGIAIMLRFFPTLGQEYRYIRNAQKFRGVGLGFWNILAHIPQITSYVLIPLVIRITKISEELSASVTVRGVRFNNDVVSFRPVRFSRKDTVSLSAGVIAFGAVLILDYTKGLT